MELDENPALRVHLGSRTHRRYSPRRVRITGCPGGPNRDAKEKSMNRAGCRLVAPLFAAALLAASARVVRADDIEHRDYVIFVDGKEAGQSRLTMIQKADGSTEVTGVAKVRVTLIGIFNAFSYDVESHETWKNNRLVELKSVAVEDGKRTEVDVTANGEQVHVRVNGKNAGLLRRDVWTSSYWKLAEPKYHGKTVPILDSDTGKEYDGELKYIGLDPLKIGSKAQDCYHFRVTGIPVPIDLWFDAHHRMVRQEFTESGHRTLVQIIAVRR
jgi:hypothetical protein